LHHEEYFLKRETKTNTAKCEKHEISEIQKLTTCQ